MLGTACGLGIEGSGWVAAPGYVVTNAHVVAGESDTDVEVGGNAAGPAGPGDRVRPARRHRGAARRRGCKLPALPLASRPALGTAVAILGYPEDGPFDARAGRIGQTQTVLTENAYGDGPVRG